jgi:hypothetical protein
MDQHHLEIEQIVVQYILQLVFDYVQAEQYLMNDNHYRLVTIHYLERLLTGQMLDFYKRKLNLNLVYDLRNTILLTLIRLNVEFHWELKIVLYK